MRTLLEGAATVVVSGHTKADGDAVGAVAAVRRHLELEGRHVTALLLEPLSPRYAFMQFARRHEVYSPARHDELVRQAAVFVMCDLSSLSRLGPLEVPVREGRCRTVCIDHHPCEDQGPADVNLLDSQATATGRIVWDYIRHVEGRVDREIAESVFVSVSTDTGWFRYSNTDAEVMRLGADLAAYGLDLPDMYRRIYQSNSTAMLRLLGHATRSMHAELGGAFVWTVIRDACVQDLDVDRFDADPILDVLRSGEAVKVVALFTELPDRAVSVSLRSRGPDVNAIARRYGGGGHAYAAGATLEPEQAEARMRAMVADIRSALRAG
ncbi:MAG TPA: DHH family phosphoesterase [Planctomycetota bacterium]|nr:DHH family phosphoesterase [Planctomycetota bacterium]